MDKDEAIWLAAVILEGVAGLDDAPGLTVEVDGNLNQWVQILFQADEDDGSLAGFELNFPYRKHSGDPLAAFEQAGLKAPPDSRSLEWEDDAFATIWIRPDVPVVALAHFIGDILQTIVGADPDALLTAQIEYGY